MAIAVLHRQTDEERASTPELAHRLSTDPRVPAELRRIGARLEDLDGWFDLQWAVGVLSRGPRTP